MFTDLTTRFDATRLEIRWHAGSPPAELVALRRGVYTEETGLLAERDLFDANDRAGRHLCLYYDNGSSRELVAAMQVLDAEAGDFGRHTGLPREVLQLGYCGSRAVVAPQYRQHGLFSLLLYVAMREYRMKGRKYMYGFMEPGDTPAARILRYRTIDGVPGRRVTGARGNAYEVVACWQDLAYGLHRAFETMPEELQGYVRDQGLIAAEIEATVRARIERFFLNPWFQRLREGTLAREHYVAVLANMHQFVRWTTRLLGQVAGYTADSTLRRHYLEHLEGEVDHEVLLEHDLNYLGADVEYVTRFMAPLVEIQEFMVTQESLCAFHRDPVLFLAVPFSVEGLSGHLPKEVLAQLVASMEAWGLQRPQKALTFLASHVQTDGGADGHWEKSRTMVQRYVTTEAQAQKFLNVVHLVMNSLERAYTAYAAIPAFTAVAAAGEKRRASAA